MPGLRMGAEFALLAAALFRSAHRTHLAASPGNANGRFPAHRRGGGGRGFDSQSLRPDVLHEHLGLLATVSVTIPIFDWGASRSRQRQARFRAQSFENERALAVRNFTQQFYSAQSQALAAASRYQLLSASVTDAERNVTASLARYRGGEAPFIEVSDSLSTLAAQRAALYQALFDYQSARARLLQLTER